MRVIFYITLLVIAASAVGAQHVDCGYDRSTPTLESAKASFRIMDLLCSKQQIVDYLAQDSISLEERASAHILLGTVYHYLSEERELQRELVLAEFREAIRAYQKWSGTLLSNDRDLYDLLEQARLEIASENEPPVLVDTEDSLDERGIGGKVWKYGRWLLAGGGIAILIYFLTRPSDSEIDDPLVVPDFPPHP